MFFTISTHGLPEPGPAAGVWQGAWQDRCARYFPARDSRVIVGVVDPGRLGEHCGGTPSFSRRLSPAERAGAVNGPSDRRSAWTSRSDGRSVGRQP